MEDNDEIEFDSSSASEANVEDGGNRKQPESPGREVDEEEVFHQVFLFIAKWFNFNGNLISFLLKTEEEPKKNRGRPSPEYTYDKAIEDYVKYSTTALSSSGGGNNKPEILNNSDDSSAQRSVFLITSHCCQFYSKYKFFILNRKEELKKPEKTQGKFTYYKHPVSG